MKLKGLRPSPRLLKGAVILAFTGLAIGLMSWWNKVPSPDFVIAMLVAAMLLVLLFDLAVSRHAPLLAVKRALPDNLSVHVQQDVQLAVANRGRDVVQFELAEHVPEHWQVEAQFPSFSLLPDEQVNTQYSITPLKRGPAAILATEFRVRSRLGLWEMSWWLDYPSEHKVYPNFTAISDLAGLKGSVNLAQSGLKKFKLRGSGMEFLQLRDYREGETIRQIDWRATSRFNKLISKEFQEEKNQHIVIMLDAGRRMRVQDEQLSYFDHALNALLMLSYTALKNGDNLSLQSFGSESRWLKHIKGAQNVSRVLNHFYDLYPAKIASDYLQAAQELLINQPKRALVLLVSCLRDEDFSDLLQAVQLLQAKHLVAVICIDEPVYEELAQKPVEGFDDALMVSSGAVLHKSVRDNMERLKKRGVICVNAPAHHLTPNVINTYLGVKRAGLL